jgi:hypothetical protein
MNFISRQQKCPILTRTATNKSARFWLADSDTGNKYLSYRERDLEGAQYVIVPWLARPPRIAEKDTKVPESLPERL